jgi:MoaA/NifB/PqqE/SkfB family radical SAM enzyme
MEISRDPPRRPEPAVSRHTVQAGPGNRIELPDELAGSLGLLEGAALEAAFDGEAVRISGNLHSLAKLYIEPTSRCNLSCAACLRQAWEPESGDMDPGTFEALAAQLPALRQLTTVVFGGFGEPTMHPRLPLMIAELKRRRLRVELISNGTLLADATPLVEAGLDRLWISLDGSNEQDLARFRAGASCAAIVEHARKAVRLGRAGGLRLGICFVAVRGNIEQIAAVWEIAKSIGADRVLVSNVLPYSGEMSRNSLCDLQQSRDSDTCDPQIQLPPMDLDETTAAALLRLFKRTRNVRLGEAWLASNKRMCRFIAQRSACIRWDGMVSPCLALLRRHAEFVNGYERRIEPWLLGNVNREGLDAIWGSETYARFREKASRFDFPPCHLCGGCELLSQNSEDCFGNQHPACGACYWASGLVQCP